MIYSLGLLFTGHENTDCGFSVSIKHSNDLFAKSNTPLIYFCNLILLVSIKQSNDLFLRSNTPMIYSQDLIWQ